MSATEKVNGLVQATTLAVASTANLDGNIVINGVTGSNGQYLRKTGGTTQTWSNFPVSDITPGANGQAIVTTGGVSTWGAFSAFTSYQRFYNNTPRNVNSGTNIFATNGVQQFNTNGSFTLNVGTGTFGCSRTGTYLWTFRTDLSTHDAQSKFLISDGTTIQTINQTDYLPGVTTTQPFSYSVVLPATQGQVWALSFVSFGVGGVMNTSGPDPVFAIPTTTLEITGV